MTPTTAAIPATLADYAALALAALEVFQASGEVRWLDTARALEMEIGERFITASGDTIEFAAEPLTPTTTPLPPRPLRALEILPDRPVPSGAALALELAARLRSSTRRSILVAPGARDASSCRSRRSSRKIP